MGEEEREAIKERVRRAINNATELREILLELLSTDPDLAQMLQGPPVSSIWCCVLLHKVVNRLDNLILFPAGTSRTQGYAW